MFSLCRGSTKAGKKRPGEPIPIKQEISRRLSSHNQEVVNVTMVESRPVRAGTSTLVETGSDSPKVEKLHSKDATSSPRTTPRDASLLKQEKSTKGSGIFGALLLPEGRRTDRADSQQGGGGKRFDRAESHSNGGGGGSVSAEKSEGKTSMIARIFRNTSKRYSVELTQNGRAAFSNFLDLCYSHEVLEFWEMTTEYIKACKKKTAGAEAIDIAKRIITEFILPTAPRKIDLGEPIEGPLVKSYESNRFESGTFDETRQSLLKLMKGLKMDASTRYGLKSVNAMSIAFFIEDEERKMHKLKFQRDVHPLLHKLRKSNTALNSGGGSSGNIEV